MNDKEIYMLGETYDGQTPEQAGYWYSDFTGNWYKKLYKKSEVIKDCIVYNWEIVTGEFELGLLNDGLVPHPSDYECGHDQRVED